jgi:microcystin-dependent protein
MSKSISLHTIDGELYVNELALKKLLPSGMITQFAGTTAPNGWLICDGSEISRTNYSGLFAVLGDKYGTVTDETKFKLPDLRERVPIGRTDSNQELGSIGGSNSVTLSTSQIPSHTHTGTTDASGLHNHIASDSGHAHTYDDAYFAENYGGGSNNHFGTSSGTDYDNSYHYRSGTVTNTGYANITVNNDGTHTHAFTTTSTGSGASIDIRNKYIVLNYIIRI